MSRIDLSAFPAGQAVLQAYPVPLDGAGSRCRVQLRNLPGATHLHVCLREDETVVFRAEIPAEGGEALRLDIGFDAAGKLDVECPGRRLVLLPSQPALPPPEQPIDLSGQRENLDLALVIDATARVFGPGGESWPLLADRQRWPAQAAKLRGFCETLAAHFNTCRCAVLAFGDQPMAGVTAADLQPAYRLYPEAPPAGLSRLADPAQVERQLLALAPSSGGDFVDALADALAACQAFHWQASARKLLLLSGDSPGHSLLQPAPKGGDACVRGPDVDSEALRLHRLGVALVTVYQDPDRGFLNDLIGPPRELQRYAEDQYRRLAALPELAFAASAFDGRREAEQVRALSGLVGQGGSYGEWLGVAEN